VQVQCNRDPNQPTNWLVPVRDSIGFLRHFQISHTTWPVSQLKNVVWLATKTDTNQGNIILRIKVQNKVL
jgi:hypothetical protein